MSDITQIIDKYFRDERIRYYSLPDAIQQDNFISYRHYQHEQNKICLSVGSNDGQVDIGVFSEKNADNLDALIKLLIY